MCNHDLRAAPVALHVCVEDEDGHHLVTVSGELDMVTRHVFDEALSAVDADDADVVVEMGDLTFMDCRGYSGLIEADRMLREHGRTMTLSNQAGQPARPLAMLGVVDAPVLSVVKG